MRVFTSKQSYTPDAKAWKTLHANTWVILSAMTGRFEDDELVADPGVLVSTPVAFCVEMDESGS